MSKTLFFNPDTDLALANGDSNYIPPSSARKMAADLALLPVWYASEEDSILVPESRFVNDWKEMTIPPRVPNIKLTTNSEKPPFQTFSPWGWNLALIRQLKTWGLPDIFMPSFSKMQLIRQLSGRQTAVQILNQIMCRLSQTHPLTGESVVCETEEAIAHEVEKYPSAMLKAPWSSSGKGLRRGQGQYLPPLTGWCSRILKQQGAVIVEPLYDKVMDFAMEFYSDGNNLPISFIGYSYFVTDANGSYKGNILMSDKDIEFRLAEYIPDTTLHTVRDSLQELLKNHLMNHYQGYIGVDMMICCSPDKDGNKRYLLHPCVEVNLRMNMGVVAHTLYERYAVSHSKGIFMVEYHPTPEALRIAHSERTRFHPIILAPDGRIEKGYQSLTPIGPDTQYCAWMVIE